MDNNSNRYSVTINRKQLDKVEIGRTTLSSTGGCLYSLLLQDSLVYNLLHTHTDTKIDDINPIKLMPFIFNVFQ